MAKHKTTHHQVAPKSPVEVTPPAVSPPGGGTADQSGLKWYQKKIMGVPMWVFLGIAGAIAAYFLYEYIAGGSAGSSATVPSSASTDPTGGTTGGDTSGGTSGGSGVVDPISGNAGVGNAGPTVTNPPPAPVSPPVTAVAAAKYQPTPAVGQKVATAVGTYKPNTVIANHAIIGGNDVLKATGKHSSSAVVSNFVGQAVNVDRSYNSKGKALTAKQIVELSKSKSKVQATKPAATVVKRGVLNAR